MKIKQLLTALSLGLVLTLMAGSTTLPGQPVALSHPGGGLPPRAVPAAPLQLPLYFIANRGQVDADIAYYAQTGGQTVAFAARQVTFALGGAALRVRFVGARPAPPLGAEELRGKVNYFLTSDPASWRTDVPTYGQVVYRNLYPGLDLVYAGRAGGLEYTLVVAPGADVGRFRLAYEGADGLRLAENGDLLVALGGAELHETRPRAWQEIGGRLAAVEAAFVLRGDGTVGLWASNYDPAYPLFIDPVLEYSTFLGGAQEDEAYDITTDSAGNVYVTGFTDSDDFPTTPGAYQPQGYNTTVVVKLDPTQSGADSLVYATYLGEHSGGYGIAVDNDGNAYVTGFTTSPDFPTTPGAYDRTCGSDGACDKHNSFVYYDVYVAKLNAAGNGLLYSTYLGGGNSELIYNGLAVDGAGAAYLAGYTLSTDFPTTEGAYDRACGTDGACNPDAAYPDGYPDCFVAKLNPAGSNLVYATYVGGSNRDFAMSVDVDGSGHAYLGGFTYSADFPTTASAYQTAHAGGDKDLLAVKLSADGSSLAYSTFLGGSDMEEGYGLAADDAGNVYLVGETYSDNFPVKNAYQQTCDPGFGCFDGVVARLDTTQSGADSLVYATYLGDSGIDVAYGVTVRDGVAYVTGWTTSPGFPTTANAYDAGCGTDGNCDYASGVRRSDLFVAQIDTARSGDSSLAYGSFFGGRWDDHGYGIAVDGQGGVYLAGETESSDFPTTAGAYDRTCGNDGVCEYDPDDFLLPYTSDMFIAAFRSRADLSPSRKLVSPATIVPTGTVTHTLAYTVTLVNSGDLPATAVHLTDTLPVSLSLTTGPACTAGACGYDAVGHIITWTGGLTPTAAITLTYAGQVSATIGATETIFFVNTAWVDDGMNAPFRLSALAAVNPRRVYLPLVTRNH